MNTNSIQASTASSFLNFDNMNDNLSFKNNLFMQNRNNSNNNNNTNYNNQRYHQTNNNDNHEQNNFMMRSNHHSFNPNRNMNNRNGNKDIPSLMSEDSFTNSSSTHEIQQNVNDNQIVLMIYNLCAKRFNCDRLFNMLCLYGNVDRVSEKNF
jgi:hypothetical protein